VGIAKSKTESQRVKFDVTTRKMDEKQFTVAPSQR
jgi:hypothetical protein